MLMGAKCPPNVDPKTGFRHGFCDGQNFPELVDMIQSKGIDLTYAEWLAELKSRATNAVAELSEEDKKKTEAEWRAFFKAMGDRLVDHHVPGYVIEELISLVDIETGTFDIQELVDVVVNDAVEHYQAESGRWLYEREGIRISLSTYNGLSLCVEKSPFIAMCKRCSPCCPNAGDLDNAWCNDSEEEKAKDEDDEVAYTYPLPTYCIPPSLAKTPYINTMARIIPEPETEKTK